MFSALVLRVRQVKPTQLAESRRGKAPLHPKQTRPANEPSLGSDMCRSIRWASGFSPTFRGSPVQRLNSR